MFLPSGMIYAVFLVISTILGAGLGLGFSLPIITWFLLRTYDEYDILSTDEKTCFKGVFLASVVTITTMIWLIVNGVPAVAGVPFIFIVWAITTPTFITIVWGIRTKTRRALPVIVIRRKPNTLT